MLAKLLLIFDGRYAKDTAFSSSLTRNPNERYESHTLVDDIDSEQFLYMTPKIFPITFDFFNVLFFRMEYLREKNKIKRLYDKNMMVNITIASQKILE